MRSVILAAGKGRRLGEVNGNRPKCLLEFGGRTLLDNIIESLLKNGIREIVLVAGYESEQIISALGKYDIRLQVVINEEYVETNTINSLWKACEYLDDDFVYFNADILFDQRIISLLLEHPFTTFATDVKKCGDEEVKVVVDSNNRIIEIGKKIEPDKCLGEFIGIAKFNRETIPMLKTSLDYYNEQLNQKNLFFEAAVNDILKDNLIKSVPIYPFKAIEIDTPEDYEKACRLSQQDDFCFSGKDRSKSNE